MTRTLEVKRDTIHPADIAVIYTDNSVTPQLVNKVMELLTSDEVNKYVKVSFDVMGATLHDILSHQLREQLVEKCDVEIDRYKCLISLKKD